MRVIAYGIPADYTDEYLRIGKDTTTHSVRRFVKMVIRLYGSKYLRAPNEDDTKRLMEMNEKRGWPGMLGSIDCMHWTWKNCPKAWHGMYCGKSHDPAIVLEAAALQDLWIWHCFFGCPGHSMTSMFYKDPTCLKNLLLEMHQRATTSSWVMSIQWDII
jgi:hypothetical protein